MDKKLAESEPGNKERVPRSGSLIFVPCTYRTLDLSYNKIGSLPDEVVGLQLLERLDLTNNNLAILPFTLGLLPYLKTVQANNTHLHTTQTFLLPLLRVCIIDFIEC